MSRIDALIAEHCPNGVSFKTLGEVGEFIRGNGLQKSQLKKAGIGAIHYGQIHTHYGTWATNTKSFVDDTLACKLRKAQPGDLVIATTSEDDKAVAKAVAWLGDAAVAVSGDAYIYRHVLDPKYVSYFFQSEQFQQQKKRHITGTKVRRIAGTSLARMRIPAPPLEVQTEIVKVLDAFAKLQADFEEQLTEEIEARRQQYQHYRDALLTFGERAEQASKQASKQASIRLMTLGEIGKFIRGRRFTKADYVDDGIAVIHYGEIYTHYGVSATTVLSRVRADMGSTLRYARPGDVVITDVGETVDDVGKAVAWLGDEEVAIHDHCYAFRHSMNPKFVAYYMQTRAFVAEKAKYVARTKVNTLLVDGFSRIIIPVPKLEEQARIVSILDEFNALTNELYIDLSMEITARRQQYKHYRDSLLSFREAA